MGLTVILLIISLSADLGIYFGCGLYTTWWLFFVPILCFPVLYVFAFALWIVFLAIYSLFINQKKPIKKPSRFVNWILGETSTQLIFLMMGHIHVLHKERLPKDSNFVLISNHLSDFDQFSLLSAFSSLRHPLLWISKPENFSVPVFGPLLYKAGYLAINRDDPIEGVRSIRKAAEMVKPGFYSMAVCPEGTRSKDHQLHEFKAGSFRAATLSGKPLVVISIKNTYKLMENLFKRKTDVYLDVVKVFSFDEIKDMKTPELSDICHKLIEDDLNKD